MNQSLSEKEYWRFTWDEHAEYDLPAMLGLMMEVTGQKEYFYLGHSMGTLTYFTACNYQAWVCNNTRLMMGYGPHTVVPHLVRINIINTSNSQTVILWVKLVLQSFVVDILPLGGMQTWRQK